MTDAEQILAQLSEAAARCPDADCARRHAERYQQQYDAALEQNRYHRNYIDTVLLGAVEMFRARELELQGNAED